MLENFINAIDDWMLADQANYIAYFVIVAVLLVIGFVIAAILYKKLGKSDERTDLIKLRINQLTLGSGFILVLLFISAIDNEVEYISQLGLIPLTLTVLAGDVITAVYYYRNK